MFNISFTQDDLKRVLWTFAQTFVAALYVTATGWSKVPNYDTAKAAVIAAGVAGIAAAISFIKNLVLADGATVK